MKTQTPDRPRHSRRLALLAGTAGIGAGLAGCYESPDITVHQPGKYQGAQDTLAAAGDRTEVLSKRFQQGQLDR